MNASEGPSAVPDSTTISDEQLMLGIQARDNQCYAELYKRYHKPVVHFLRKYMGDEHAAEDVCQEVFIKIFQAADTFDVSKRVRPWLYAVATKRAVDYFRRNGRRKEISLDLPRTEKETFINLLEADGEHPLQGLLDEERAAILNHSLGRLDDKKRTTLLMRMDGLTRSEIAGILLIPVGTVKSRLGKVKEQLADDEELGTYMDT